jgi:hypothetical protein
VKIPPGFFIVSFSAGSRDSCFIPGHEQHHSV